MRVGKIQHLRSFVLSIKVCRYVPCYLLWRRGCGGVGGGVGGVEIYINLSDLSEEI